jgi:hypothetical protein
MYPNAVLTKKGVVRQQYHKNSLNGGHAHLLCTHAKEIIEGIAVVWKTSTARRTHLATDISEKIDRFLEINLDALDIFDAICGIMCLMEHQHNEEEKAMFRLMTKAFDKIWREDLGYSGPPKLHALVGHAPDQLDEFGNLADWSEERTEHLHHDVYVWERVWANTKWNWERKQIKIYETLEQGDQAGVVKAVSAAMESSKRNFSALTVLKRSEKAEADKNAKHARRQDGFVKAETKVGDPVF